MFARAHSLGGQFRQNTTAASSNGSIFQQQTTSRSLGSALLLWLRGWLATEAAFCRWGDAQKVMVFDMLAVSLSPKLPPYSCCACPYVRPSSVVSCIKSTFSETCNPTGRALKLWNSKLSHLFSHSLSHSLSLIHSFTHSLTHSLIHSPIHPLT